MNQVLRIYPTGVRQQFPRAHLLTEMEAECYVGVPLFDTHRRPLGLLTLYDSRPYNEKANAHAVFAARAGAEIQRHRTEQALFEERERALVTLHSIGDAVIRTDAKGAVDYMNPVAEQLTGWSQQEAAGMSIDLIFTALDEGTRQPVESAIMRVLAECRTINGTDHTILLSRHGQEYAVERSAAPVQGRNGECLGAVMVFRDVSEARRLAQEISYQATHGALSSRGSRRRSPARATITNIMGCALSISINSKS